MNEEVDSREKGQPPSGNEEKSLDLDAVDAAVEERFNGLLGNYYNMNFGSGERDLILLEAIVSQDRKVMRRVREEVSKWASIVLENHALTESVPLQELRSRLEKLAPPQPPQK